MENHLVDAKYYTQRGLYLTMAKTLRIRTREGWVTKNPANIPENWVSAEEIDDNFISLDEKIDLAETTLKEYTDSSVGSIPEPVIDYVAGREITTYKTLIKFGDNLYIVKSSVNLPYVLSGTFDIDVVNLIKTTSIDPPPATDEIAGIVRFATPTEVDDGVSVSTVVSPATTSNRINVLPDNDIKLFRTNIFTAPASIYLPETMGGEWAIFSVSASVDLSMGACLISAPIGQKINTPEGPVDSISIVSTGYEIKIINISGSWSI